MNLFATADIVAIAFFVVAWMVYAITLERTGHGRNSLNARMSIYREVWVRRILDRETRMVDMQIMASLPEWNRRSSPPPRCLPSAVV